MTCDDFHTAGWSFGWALGVDSCGQTIWNAAAHRSDGKRFILRADEKLTAFLELEAVIRAWSRIGIDDRTPFSRLFEIALVLVGFDHVTSRIVNANHCMM